MRVFHGYGAAAISKNTAVTQTVASKVRQISHAQAAAAIAAVGWSYLQPMSASDCAYSQFVYMPDPGVSVPYSSTSIYPPGSYVFCAAVVD